MKVYMPGLTWDCACGAVNDASDSSCSLCGRSPADATVPVVARRALPFSAAAGGSASVIGSANGTGTLVAHPPEPDPWPVAAPVAPVLASPPPAPEEPANPANPEGAEDDLPAAAVARDSSPGSTRAARPARARPNLFDEPEPEAEAPRGTRRRSAAFSFGFVIVMLALIVALAVVVLVVDRSGHSAPPNPNQVTTASLP